MNTFRIARACLVQPASLMAVALLVINDHFLKAAMPSWLTGKLSDFAGLFFFPFVLAAGLSPLRLKARATGAIAVFITGVWFTLMKISPDVNGFTKQLFTILTGLPSEIVLDPTDLLALVSLWPAWQLWARVCQEAPRRTHPPRRAEWLILMMASLATLATSCPPVPSVDKIIPYEGILYARYTSRDSFDTLSYSADGGRTWRETALEEAPTEVVQQFENFHPSNQRVCDPLQSEVCYRLTGQPKIEQSLDNGATWQTSWELPAARDDFMWRYLNPPDVFGFLPACPQDYVTLHPQDLEVIVVNHQTWVVAALGAEGVLVRAPDGHWERVAVLNADPTPYAVSDAHAFSLMGYEALNWLGGALLTSWLLTALYQRAALTPAHSRRTRFMVWAGVLIFGALLIIWFIFTALYPDAAKNGYTWPMWSLWVLFGAWFFMLLATVSNFWLMLITVIIVSFIVIGLLRLITRFWRSIGWPKIDKRLTRATRVIGLATLIAGYLPFPFWAWGLIVEYDHARYLALAFTLLVWLVGGLWLKRRHNSAAQSGIKVR